MTEASGVDRRDALSRGGAHRVVTATGRDQMLGGEDVGAALWDLGDAKDDIDHDRIEAEQTGRDAQP